MPVPSGNQIKLTYEAGKAPVLAVRIQELLFGMIDTPKIARNRQPVLVHLLARIPRATNPGPSPAFGKTPIQKSKKISNVIPNTREIQTIHSLRKRSVVPNVRDRPNSEAATRLVHCKDPKICCA